MGRDSRQRLARTSGLPLSFLHGPCSPPRAVGLLLAGCINMSNRRNSRRARAPNDPRSLGEPPAAMRCPAGDAPQVRAGPYGRETWMLDVDANGALVAAASGARRANFNSIKAGMTRDELLRTLGRPSRVGFVGWQNQTVWNYRYSSLLPVVPGRAEPGRHRRDTGYSPDRCATRRRPADDGPRLAASMTRRSCTASRTATPSRRRARHGWPSAASRRSSTTTKRGVPGPNCGPGVKRSAGRRCSTARARPGASSMQHARRRDRYGQRHRAHARNSQRDPPAGAAARRGAACRLRCRGWAALFA